MEIKPTEVFLDTHYKINFRSLKNRNGAINVVNNISQISSFKHRQKYKVVELIRIISNVHRN